MSEAPQTTWTAFIKRVARNIAQVPTPRRLLLSAIFVMVGETTVNVLPPEFSFGALAVFIAALALCLPGVVVFTGTVAQVVFTTRLPVGVKMLMCVPIYMLTMFIGRLPEMVWKVAEQGPDVLLAVAHFHLVFALKYGVALAVIGTVLLALKKTDFGARPWTLSEAEREQMFPNDLETMISAFAGEKKTAGARFQQTRQGNQVP